MWGKYNTDANESSIPLTFKASDEAVAMHNEEVFTLTSRVAVAEGKNVELEAENKDLAKGFLDLVSKCNKTKAENKKLQEALKNLLPHVDDAYWPNEVDEAEQALKDDE